MVETDKPLTDNPDQLPVPSKNSSGRYLFYGMKGDTKVLMPLTKVDIKTEIRGARAVTKVELCYVNPSKENPYECTYTFPIDKTVVLASFEAKIDDRVIKTQVKAKEEAKADYEDAIASGKAAALVERKKKEEVMTVKLGNLLPGQTASLKSEIISQLDISGGFYSYILPAAYFPDYKKHGVKEAGAYPYEFSSQVRIISEGSICNLSIPDEADVSQKNDSRTDLTIQSKSAGRSFEIFYRTTDMMIPQLQYAKIADSSDYVVSASMVPTFDAVQPQDIFEVVKDDKPEQIKLSNGSEFHFIFIVDRSGSMGMCNRMKIAVDALGLFVRSLPKDCSFSIIGFGSSYHVEQIGGGEVAAYQNENKQSALDLIKNYGSDYGGTEILQPLIYAQSSLQSGKKKRIFLLTDGSVGAADRVIEKAREANETQRVFSFGLGSGCDKYLVEKVAVAGRGTSTIVRDNDPNLNGLVIKALSNAMEPSLCDTRYGFNDQLTDAKEIFRNSLISETRLMNPAQFEQLKFSLKTKASDTRQALDLSFTKDDFREVTGDAAQTLHKVGVFNELESSRLESNQDKIDLSIKYQVLCDLTAIVGVQKQTQKATGELIESEIKFGKEASAQEDLDDNMYGMMLSRSRGGGGGGPRGGARMMKKRAAPKAMMMRQASNSPPQEMMMMKSAAAPRRDAPMMMKTAEAAAPRKEAERRSSNMDSMKAQLSQRQGAIQSKRRCAGSESDESEDDDDEDEEDYRGGAIFADLKSQSAAPMQVEMKQESLQMMNVESDELAFTKEAIEEVKGPTPSIAPATKKVEPLPAGKPEFTVVINGQTTDGCWAAGSESILAACIDGGDIQDQAVRDALSSVALQNGADSQIVYLTLLAMYILREAFADYEDEWQLIFDNARIWLESVGVSQTKSLVKKFSLTVLD